MYTALVKYYCPQPDCSPFIPTQEKSSKIVSFSLKGYSECYLKKRKYSICWELFSEDIFGALLSIWGVCGIEST